MTELTFTQFQSDRMNYNKPTQEVKQLRVQSLQQDTQLVELLLHGLLRLLKVLVLQKKKRGKTLVTVYSPSFYFTAA